MNIPNDLASALKGLTFSQLKEVRTFVFYLRTKSLIAPDQAYFWTRKWQAMERAASLDKRRGKILGDGTAAGLIRSLRS